MAVRVSLKAFLVRFGVFKIVSVAFQCLKGVLVRNPPKPVRSQVRGRRDRKFVQERERVVHARRRKNAQEMAFMRAEQVLIVIETCRLPPPARKRRIDYVVSKSIIYTIPCQTVFPTL